jgi:CheY-like chemotaxis protein
MNQLQGKRILIAEDDFVNQMLIKHSLDGTGAIFEIAGNGREAVQKLQNGNFDIVLMDINMPEMDGFQATKYIREKLNNTIPIIAMTGWSSKTETNKFEETGMNGVLAKPFGLDAFYETLEKIFATLPSQVATSQEPQNNTVLEASDLDLSMLNELAGNDVEYKTTILSMFLESLPETMQAMEEALAKGDWETLRQRAHFAKSSLSVVKVEELWNLAQSIEQKAKHQQDLDQVPGQVSRFKEKLAHILTAVQQVLQQLTGT